MLEIAKLEEFYPKNDQSNQQINTVSQSLKVRIGQYEKQGFTIWRKYKQNGQMNILLYNPKPSIKNEASNDENFLFNSYQKPVTYYKIAENEIGVIKKFMFKFPKKSVWQKLLLHNFCLKKCQEINTLLFQANSFIIMTIDLTENPKNYNIGVQFYSWTPQVQLESQIVFSTFFDKNLQDKISNFPKRLQEFCEIIKTILNFKDSESLSSEGANIRHFKIYNLKSKIIQTISVVQEFEKEKMIYYQPDNSNDLYQLTYENNVTDTQFYEFILDVDKILSQNQIQQDLFLNYYYDDDDNYIYIPTSNSSTLRSILENLNPFQFSNIVHIIISLLQFFKFQLALIQEKKDYIITLNHLVMDDSNQLKIDLLKMHEHNVLLKQTRIYMILEGLQLFKNILYCIFDILSFLKDQNKQQFIKNQENFLKSQVNLLQIFEKLHKSEISIARIQTNIQEVLLVLQSIESNTK